jgi:LuxR family maltose regulon positive regulatory protein
MSTLLETKLYVPQPVGDTVPRFRLYSLLDGGLRHKLTLICAPAGFGKTTVAATWLNSLVSKETNGEANNRIAWYALDEHDNDLHTFVAYLVAAVRSSDLHLLSNWVDLDKRPAAPGPEEAAAELIEALSQGQLAQGGKLIIALDDYHYIVEEQIHRFVIYLLRYLPADVHVLITSRFDPPVGLAQLRLRNQMSEVRAQQLAFELDEAGDFLRETVSADLDQRTIGVLWQQTEGWAAGLRLAAISMYRVEDRGRFVDGFAQNTSRHIADYLVDEVLASQTEDVQNFLLRTSILERMCDDLCTAVAGSANNNLQPMLELLGRRGLFVIPLDEFGEWFRYHGQFRAMLQRRLRRQAATAEVAALHKAAAQWLAPQGLVDEALHHFVCAGAADDAMSLLEQQIPELLRREHWRRAGHWLKMLPPEEVAQRPALRLLQAWLCYRDLNYQCVREHVMATASLLEAKNSAATGFWGREALQGQILALRASTVFDQETNGERIDLAEAGLRLLPQGFDWVRAFVTNVLAQALAERDGLAAGLALLESKKGSAGVDEYALRLCFSEAVLHYFHGSIADLERTLRRFEALAYQLDLPLHQQWANWAFSGIHLERNEPEAALARLEAVFARPDLALFQTLRLAAISLLQLYARNGHRSKGEEVLEVLRKRLYDNPDPFTQAEIKAVEALWSLLCGDLPAAAVYARAASSEASLVNVPYRGVILVSICRTLGSAADLEKGAEIAGRLAAEYGSIRHVRLQSTMLVLLAQTQWLAGKQVRALEALRQALSLSYHLGFRNLFTSQGPLMSEMLYRLTREEAYAAMAGNLLAEILPQKDTSRQPLMSSVLTTHTFAEGSLIIEPLSDRELEVLELLARKLGNKEIALQLQISPLTVRNHTVHIYDKLHVDSRRQAVARAQELGILPH